MEIKTKYQYTYFIYPYVIDEKKYEKYLYHLLTNKNCKIKQFEKEKDAAIYEFFLPKVRDYMFWNLGFQKEKMKKLREFDARMQAVLLQKYPCTIFEYEVNKDIQGKAGDRDGIFFHIRNVELVCFQTGICFLLLKTTLDEDSTLQDLCNFNYKFRDINSSTANLKQYDNIHIQTDTFQDVKGILGFIKDLTGDNRKAKNLNIDTERFITYSYACVGQENWNSDDMRELLDKEFNKYANIEPADAAVDYQVRNRLENIPDTKMGFVSNGTVLLTSDSNTENYTKLPLRYENEYLYSYLYELHKKIFLNKMNQEFKTTIKFRDAKGKFIHFIQKVMIEEITNDHFGTELIKVWEDTLGLNDAFGQTKQKYDMLYKNINIEKTARSNKWILVILVILVIINIINSLNLHN